MLMVLEDWLEAFMLMLHLTVCLRQMQHLTETKSERKKLRVKASVNCPFPLLDVVIF